MIEKIRDELRHKKEEENRRLTMCKEVQKEIEQLEEEINSMNFDSQDQDELQVDRGDFIEEFFFQRNDISGGMESSR